MCADRSSELQDTALSCKSVDCARHGLVAAIGAGCGAHVRTVTSASRIRKPLQAAGASSRRTTTQSLQSLDVNFMRLSQAGPNLTQLLLAVPQHVRKLRHPRQDATEHLLDSQLHSVWSAAIDAQLRGALQSGSLAQGILAICVRVHSTDTPNPTYLTSRRSYSWRRGSTSRCRQ